MGTPRSKFGETPRHCLGFFQVTWSLFSSSIIDLSSSCLAISCRFGEHGTVFLGLITAPFLDKVIQVPDNGDGRDVLWSTMAL